MTRDQLDAILNVLIIATNAVTIAWWLVKLTIRSELDSFKAELGKYLDGSYIRRAECALMHDETQRRINRLENAERG